MGVIHHHLSGCRLGLKVMRLSGILADVITDNPLTTHGGADLPLMVDVAQTPYSKYRMVLGSSDIPCQRLASPLRMPVSVTSRLPGS